MIALKELHLNNPLMAAIFRDYERFLPQIEIRPSDIYIPDEVDFDELQFFIHSNGFYLSHMLTWCRQIDFALEYLTNFDYGRKMSSSRAEHLIYNIENYLIRLNSVYDRSLQLVNSVFHLGIHEENVNHSIIVSNLKVSHRKEIKSSLKKIKKYFDSFAQARHTILHKHSWMEEDLRRLEFFYSFNAGDLRDGDKLKDIRRNMLVDYINAKKKEFASINSGLAKLIQELFQLLAAEYDRQMLRIWKDIYAPTSAHQQ